MKALITLFVIISFSFGFSQDEAQIYQMKALGMNIGTLQTSMKTMGEEIHYYSSTILNINLVFKKVKMEVENTTRYRGGKLISTTSQVIVNGDLHSSSSIEWKNGQYLVTVDGESKPSLKAPINYSGTLFYYQEPKGISQVLSESSGVFMSLKSLGEGKYHAVDPKNERDMIYYYEKGVQTKIAIKHPLVTVYMIRKLPFAEG